uniref:Uncharacterized protein n=1 Tax=Babesia bovis TaxID=5865 RepID=S6BPM1_BABBO|nr:hypothetical protein [Babesia bovis]
MSFNDLLSLDLPPNITIMVAAGPSLHRSAEWYTLLGGCLRVGGKETSTQQKGDFSTFRYQTSLLACCLHDISPIPNHIPVVTTDYH